MNLLLLFDADFLEAGRVRLGGRRLRHVRDVHRAEPGRELVVGRAIPADALAGRPSIGRGTVTRLDAQALEMDVVFDREAPEPLPLTLVLALPRPKVLNRVVAGAVSMGVKRIHLVNAWRVEKSYWNSPRLAEENLLAQSILGLEQGRDTRLPAIETHRFFRPFVEARLPELARGTVALAAHPGAVRLCPRTAGGPVTLVVGPEGGFVADELASLERAGCALVSFGPRILRVETAVAALIGRLF